MRRYYEALNRDPFEVIPLTFHIQKGCIDEDSEYQNFLLKFKEYEALKKTPRKEDNEKLLKKKKRHVRGLKMIRDPKNGIVDHPTIDNIITKETDQDGCKAAKDQTGLTPT